MWSEKRPHSPADDYDDEKAAGASHQLHRSDSHATEVSFNGNIWEETALMLEANKVQQRVKTHANTADVKVWESVKHELRPAFFNKHTSYC